MTKYHHVNFLWDDAKAASLDPVGRLIYRSNLLGSDQRITNTGGGNTSAKITENGSAHRRARRGAVGQGLRRRPPHQHPGEFLLALPGEAARPAEQSTPPAPTRASSRRPRTTWSACSRTPPSISIRAPPRSTPRCTASFPASTSITCTPTRSSPSPLRRTARS